LKIYRRLWLPGVTTKIFPISAKAHTPYPKGRISVQLQVCIMTCKSRGGDHSELVASIAQPSVNVTGTIKAKTLNLFVLAGQKTHLDHGLYSQRKKTFQIPGSFNLEFAQLRQRPRDLDYLFYSHRADYYCDPIRTMC